MLPVMNATRRVKVQLAHGPGTEVVEKLLDQVLLKLAKLGHQGLLEFLPLCSSERQCQTRHRGQTRWLLSLPAAFQALGVGGLPRVLQAVRNRADQPDAERDRRVPAGVHDAVQIIVAQPAQNLLGLPVDRLVVVSEQLPRGPHGVNLVRVWP